MGGIRSPGSCDGSGFHQDEHCGRDLAWKQNLVSTSVFKVSVRHVAIDHLGTISDTEMFSTGVIGRGWFIVQRSACIAGCSSDSEDDRANRMCIPEDPHFYSCALPTPLFSTNIYTVCLSLHSSSQF